MSITGYGCGSKSDQYVYMYSNAKGSDNQIPAKGDGFPFNFAPVDSVDVNNFTFGNDTVPETYYNLYQFNNNCAKQNKQPPSNNIPDYFVFDTEGTTEFYMHFKPSAGDASGGFNIYLEGLMVLEVKKDSNLPANFSTTDWSSIYSN